MILPASTARRGAIYRESAPTLFVSAPSIVPPKVLEGDEATVTVHIPFPCSVPFAGAIACGQGRQIALTQRERVTVAGCDQHD